MKQGNTQAEIVKKTVTIPMLFESLIVPEMGGYYSDYNVNFELRPVVKCCLHDENTPSMRYFEETNSFYCYGCGSGGDVIELYRRYLAIQHDKRTNFNECVDYLYKHYIQNKPQRATQVQSKEGAVLNSKLDLLKYSLTVERIEYQVNQLQDMQKTISMYNLIDNLTRLVLLDRLDTKQAEKRLTQALNENK